MTKNFEFINDFKSHRLNEIIEKIEENINHDHFNFALEIGNLIEAAILIGLDLDEENITLYSALQKLEDEYRIKTHEGVPPTISFSFNTIRKSRNDASHFSKNVSSYTITKLTFDQKIHLLRSAFNILVFIWNTWLLEFSSKEEISINLFNSEIYFVNNGMSQNVIEKIKDDPNDDELIGIDKISIGNFILNKNTFFYIPPYQRRYSWNEQIVGDLLENIVQNLENNSESQFFGTMAIVTKQEKSRLEFRLIDGQQRVTTSLIIFKTIFQLMSKYKNLQAKDFPQDLLDNFVLGKRINTEKIFSVTGDDKDAQALKTLLDLTEENTEEILRKKLTIYKTTNVVKNYMFIYDYLNEDFNNWEKINLFYNYFANKYMISCIDFKKNLSQEMEIFENLNSKGMELSVLELIKNTIFLKIKEDIFETNEKEIVKVFKKYVDITHILETYGWKITENSEALEKEFIYEYIAFKTKKSNHRKERRDLLHSFNKLSGEKKIVSLEEYNEVCYELGKVVSIFVDLELEEFLNVKHYLHDLTNEMYLFKEKTALKPILFYLIEIYSDGNWDPETKQFILAEENLKLLQKSILEIEKWIWSLVQTRGGQSPMKPILNLMIFLAKNESKTIFKKQIPMMIRDWLAGRRGGDYENEKGIPTNVPDAQTPSKEEFINALRERPLKTPVQKILMKRIEMYAIDKDRGNKEIYFKKGSIEHIIPQKIKGTAWITEISQQENKSLEEIEVQHDRKKDMIGNLLWLPPNINSSISNKNFGIKQKEYKSNSVAAAALYDSDHQSLFDLSSFTYENMKKRTESLINLVVETIYNYEKE